MSTGGKRPRKQLDAKSAPSRPGASSSEAGVDNTQPVIKNTQPKAGINTNNAKSTDK